VSLTSPRLKLNLILDCARSISQELQLAAQFSEADLANTASHMTADECVIVFIYVIIRASEVALLWPLVDHHVLLSSDISNLATQLHYIRSLCSKDTLFGEFGFASSIFCCWYCFCDFFFSYFLSTLELSMSWVKNLSDATQNLSDVKLLARSSR
jgi:hypothetical protein